MAVIISSGTSTVSSGSILTSPSILSAGEVWGRSGGKVVNANIYSSGHEYVYSGGIDSGASITRNGSMRISYSGSAVNPTVGSGGTLIVDEGAVRSAVVLTSGVMAVSGRSSAAGITRGYAYNTVVSGGTLNVFNYASISGTQVKSGFWVFSAGSAFATTLGVSGAAYDPFNPIVSVTVRSGATMTSTTVYDGVNMYIHGASLSTFTMAGSAYVDVDGKATITDMTINGGDFNLASGGSITNLTMSGGSMDIFSGANVKNATVTGGSLFLMWCTSSGAPQLESAMVSASGKVIVSSGGRLANVTVCSGGSIIFSGGFGTGIKEDGGWVTDNNQPLGYVSNTFSKNLTWSATIHKNTVMSGGTVSSGGRLYVYSDGKVSSVTVANGGYIAFSSGATGAVITENGGYVAVNSGANVQFASNTFSANITQDATAHIGTTVSGAAIYGGGRLHVLRYGSANRVFVNSAGTLKLSAVTPEWQLAGVADYNADGTDDIAWANTDTGLVGYWQIENKELASWANICTLS